MEQTAGKSIQDRIRCRASGGRCPECGSSRRKRNCCRQLLSGKEHPRMLHKLAQPTVFIPVFPGTNCEYDSTRAFERAGAKVITQVFSNLSAEDIRGSVDAFEKAINQAQIIMFLGGFSAGDEPDGSAKFFATHSRMRRSKKLLPNC